MDVSLEAYRIIVRSVGRRSDIAALCGVSRAFRNAAERALYNTLTFSDGDPRLCATLARSPRIADLVVALTVQVRRHRHDEDEDEDEDEEEEESEDEEEGDSESGASPKRAGSSPSANKMTSIGGGESTPPTLDDYWSAVAGALRNTTRLRHLTIDIADPADSANAWVLDGCAFQLRTFHCDFDWDHALRAFLTTQSELRDLSLRDYRELEDNVPPVAGPQSAAHTDAPATDTPTTDVPPHTLEPPIPPDTKDTIAPQPTPSPALPALATLECTFSEAAVALIPGRPLSRLKTCFSRPDSVGKRAELVALLGALRHSTQPIGALDIADESYTESGSMELLHRISHTHATSRELRYLGTLALPVGGRKVRRELIGGGVSNGGLFVFRSGSTSMACLCGYTSCDALRSTSARGNLRHRHRRHSVR
jgi:hypothetical protein